MTTQYFHEVIVDKAHPDRKITFECGCVGGSSAADVMYLEINGEMFALDEATGRKLCEAVENVGFYLRYTGHD